MGRWLTNAGRLVSRLEHWLLPPHCVLCGSAGDTAGLDICAACRRDLPRNVPACQRCAVPLGTSVRWAPWCGHCLARLPAWDTAFSAFRYEFPVDHLLTGLKFHRRLANGRVMGRCMAAELLPWLALRGDQPLPQALIPVPLHRQREWRRGFNQARELAQPLAAALGLPLCLNLARRAVATREQSGLDGVARRRNLRGAFEISGRSRLQHVAIVDDVMTTGSTAGELTGALKAHGVERVEVWSCARAARSYHG